MNDFVQHQESMRGSTSSQKQTVPQAELATRSWPSHDDIARRAYDIYERKGRSKGHCQQNWQQAERELGNPDAAQVAAAHPVSRDGSHTSAESVMRTTIDVMPSNRSGRGSSHAGATPGTTPGAPATPSPTAARQTRS